MIVTEDRLDCALCGSPGEPLYDGLTDRLFGAPGTWGHRRCLACRLVWLDPQPRAETIGELYERYFTHEERSPESRFKRAVKRGIPAALYGYDDCVDDADELRLGRWLARIGPLREVAEQSIMALPAPLRGRLLDVGCGSGELLRHMRSLGWEVTGSEPDPRAREVARAALGPDSVFEDVVDAPLPDAGFDAVTLNHVIEHLTDPQSTLLACHRVLRPGGRLVVATPNVESRGHRRFGSDWLHLDPPRHVMLYAPRTLRDLVASAGFTIEGVSTPSATAHFVWLASRLLQRHDALPGVDVGAAGPGSAIAGLVFWAAEYLRVRQGQTCGEEVLLVATRPEST